MPRKAKTGNESDGNQQRTQETSSAAHKLSAKGHNTEKATEYLLKRDSPPMYAIGEFMRKLNDAIESWNDEEAANVVMLCGDPNICPDLNNDRYTSDLCRWIMSHVNDADSVRECMKVEPPKGVQITRLLSKTTGQKLVFEANWEDCTTPDRVKDH